MTDKICDFTKNIVGKKGYEMISVLFLGAMLAACSSSQPAHVQPSAGSRMSISVLGDSYSTYEGYMATDTNLVWYYPKGSTGGYHDSRNGNDVSDVSQTWWHLLCKEHGYRLEANNSFSGSTICYTGYRDRQTGRPRDFTNRSFVSRVTQLGSPDIILICGGTNDSWAGVPIGEYKWQDWTDSDLHSFRPAMACMLHRAQGRYPNVPIYFILNSELKPEINESVDSVCTRYGVELIRLHDIEKQRSHPSVLGMKAFADQVADALAKSHPSGARR